MRQGKWNGTENIKYQVVTYKVMPGDIPTWWQNAFIGTERQGILITHVDKMGIPLSAPFLIDNQDGAGWVKIQAGGTPNLSHRSISGEALVDYSEIPENEINKVFNVNQYTEDNKIFEDYLKVNHPEDYEKLKRMKSFLLNSKSKLN